MIQWLYQKIFIAIVPSQDGFDVTIAIYKRKKRLDKIIKIFSGETSFKDMVKFIQKQIEITPLYYIAMLNPDVNQGAIEGCSIHEVAKDDDMSGAKTLCRNQKWVIYTSLRELDLLQKKYSPIGLDCLFSPFSVIEHFFADKISSSLSLYALAQKNSFSIAFFENGKLEYAHHYPLHMAEIENIAEKTSPLGFTVGVDEEKGIHLDEIESLDDLDIIDDLDDLNDIEDLDSLEEIAEFREDMPTLEEEKITQFQGVEFKAEMDRFNDDFSRFELIQKTLSRFYAGEHCHNRFVETIYIADAYGSGSELKRYLEEELFLNVMIRRIDLGEEVISLSLEEGL